MLMTLGVTGETTLLMLTNRTTEDLVHHKALLPMLPLRHHLAPLPTELPRETAMYQILKNLSKLWHTTQETSTLKR